ncbi:embigin isoform X1 [Pezoporus flaviventris]|uniref:embigin isoform X1 n=1 Tax=Pezoporus flaviventris TaxID=889875 RepID=UPI002AB2F3BB|nr:embigin isoform X1 [Pezoporus flaviventris]
MLAASAGKCLGGLLLVCLYLSLSGGSSADPAMTTQDASSQSQANSLTNMKNELNESFLEPMATTQIVSWQTQGRPSDPVTLEHEVSVPGPNLATKEYRQTSSQSITSVQYELLLPGASGTSVETTISLEKVVEVELTCILDKEYSYLKSFQVSWKRGNETISHTNKTDNSWSIKVSVSDSSKLGSYNCTLKGEKELSGIFHLQVPKIKGKEKPTISYLRDTAVMTCECPGYTAISWTWYMTNGSKQIVINESLLADRYVISKKSASITQLKILKLTKEDGGEYWCEATFELGKSEGRLELKVLSFMAPLKPFIAIVIEVVILVALIVCYEIYSTKVKRTEAEKEFDQIEHLKSEDGGLESSEARQRRI